MSTTIRWPHKPTQEELEEFKKATENFKGVAFDTLNQAEILIKKAKTPVDIIGIKFVNQFRNKEIAKLIKQRMKEISKQNKKEVKVTPI